MEQAISDRELRVLVLEDVPADAELELRALRDAEIALVSLRVDTRGAFVTALAEFKPDIVLADYGLPAFNGREALEIVRRDHPEIPVVMVTGSLGDETAAELLKVGAKDYVLKDNLKRLPHAVQRAMAEELGIRARKAAEQALRESEETFRSIAAAAQDAVIMMDHEGRISFWNEAATRILGHAAQEALGAGLHDLFVPERFHDAVLHGLKQFWATGTGPMIGRTVELAARHRDGGEFPVELSLGAVHLRGQWHAIGILRDISERQRIAEEQHRHGAILRRSLEESIQAIAATVEMRDPYTAGHQRRVAHLCVAIAREMGLDEDRIQGLHLAAGIHDLGKIHIPAELLSKPGRLSAIEFDLIKAHPQVGYDIIKDVQFPWPIAQMILQHHERLDGSGYPRGLQGDQILLESKILSVADVVEAMASYRPYRAALGVDVALGEVIAHRGSRYDAGVVDICVRLFRERRFAFEAGK